MGLKPSPSKPASRPDKHRKQDKRIQDAATKPLTTRRTRRK
jgi:hypothetical protein